MRVTPGVHDGAAGGELDVLLSIAGIKHSPSSEVMMDLHLPCLPVDWQLAADLAVWKTGGVLNSTLVSFTKLLWPGVKHLEDIQIF